MLQFFLQKCRKSLLLRNPLQRRFCAKISVCSFLCRASAAHPADYQLIASTGSGREKTAVIAAPRARRDPRSNVYIWRFRNEWRLAISPASPLPNRGAATTVAFFPPLYLEFPRRFPTRFRSRESSSTDDQRAYGVSWGGTSDFF